MNAMDNRVRRIPGVQDTRIYRVVPFPLPWENIHEPRLTKENENKITLPHHPYGWVPRPPIKGGEIYESPLPL